MKLASRRESDAAAMATRIRAVLLIASIGLGGVLDAGAESGPELVSTVEDRGRLIYGADDRLEYFELTDTALLRVFDSEVMLVESSLVSSAADGGFDVDALAFGTFGEFYGLCESEPYADQPVPGSCSGFAVGDDLLVTAGHCITGPADCADTTFVFGFRMNDAKTATSHFKADDVYSCIEIVSRVDDGSLDYAIVRTDRPIIGHAALPVRRSGAVEDLPPGGDELFMVGHPTGLPAKIAGGAMAQGGGNADYFEANVDAYGGNSGSLVFSRDVDGSFLRAEGILVRGNADFVVQGACVVSNQCPDTGCPGHEDVTRITQLEALIPLLCGNGNHDVGEECDDGNISAGDGCSGSCTCEAGPDLDGDGLSDACDPCTVVDPGQTIDVKPKLILKKVNTDPTGGNDGLSLKGEFHLASDFATVFPDVSSISLAVRVLAADGRIVLDEAIPSGAFAGTSGWKANSAGTKLSFSDKTKPATSNGIAKLAVQDRSKKSPGRVKLLMKGKAGTYPVAAGDEPLDVVLVYGDRSVGECAQTAFGPAACGFNGNGSSLKCTQ